MIQVKFSPQSTGACPICARYRRCDIIDDIRESTQKNCAAVADDTMEIVIYRCPEFKEQE